MNQFKQSTLPPIRSILEHTKALGVGVHDPISALIAAEHDFDFLWIGSFGLSAANGLADVGLLDASDVMFTISKLIELTRIPIIVDIETGYGDPLKVYHTVRRMAAAGVAAICIEDNPINKRCSLYQGYDRVIATKEEHVARIRACIYAIEEEGANCKVIARTEALVARLGVDEALSRAEAYYNAGAHAIFPQSVVADGCEILEFCERWNRRSPIVLTPTRYTSIPRHDLYTVGATHLIYANHAIRAVHGAVKAVFAAIQNGMDGHLVDREISSVEDVASLVHGDEVRRIDSYLHETKVI